MPSMRSYLPVDDPEQPSEQDVSMKRFFKIICFGNFNKLGFKDSKFKKEEL
jgi:hypothetical protein